MTFFWVDHPLARQRCSYVPLEIPALLTAQGARAGSLEEHTLCLEGSLIQLKSWKSLSEYMLHLTGDSQLTLPGWWLLVHVSLPDSFVSIHLPCCKSTHSSKVDCKFPAPKTFCFQWDEGLFTCVASQLWPQYLSLHSSHLYGIPRFALPTWVSLPLPVQPPGGRTAIESKGSSVYMEITLCSYLGNTWEDLGWPLHYGNHFVQGQQELHKEWRFMEDVLENDLSWFQCAECCKGCEIKKNIMLRSRDMKQTSVLSLVTQY